MQRATLGADDSQRPHAKVRQRVRYSREREKGSVLMRHKLLDLAVALAKQSSDVICGTVPQPNPDHLRRRPIQNGEPMKIFILADNHE